MLYPRDKNGVEMTPGKMVKTPTEHLATIVFANWALRFCIEGTDNLDKNGSLVFCDRWKPNEFEAINQEVNK